MLSREVLYAPGGGAVTAEMMFMCAFILGPILMTLTVVVLAIMASWERRHW